MSLSPRMSISLVRYLMSPLERVQMLNAPLEKVLKAKVNVVRKDGVHWVSALLHRPPRFPQLDLSPSVDLPY